MATLSIRPLRDAREAEICAQMMARSEPWKTLRRDYDASYKLVVDPAKEVTIAELDADIVGLSVITMQGPFIGYIQSICVAERWRGHGIGTQLIAHAEQRIFRDAPNVFLCVSSFNSGAQRLYERLGYQVVGELADYIIVGHSELLLRKTIAPLMDYKGGQT
jgi:[ribosomal protein S18]-alanine N-acetyltransferase